MCGIVGMQAQHPVNQDIFDALTILQHRGQDAAGIMTHAKGQFFLRKANGLVRDVFQSKHMLQLKGNLGIGHVRYPTAGSHSEAEAQPFYVNAPFGIALAHNGNLTNTESLRSILSEEQYRHLNTDSDSEVILNVFAAALQKQATLPLESKHIFAAIQEVYRYCQGAYAVVLLIAGVGLVGFRDPHGIRPLIFGQRSTPLGFESMLASESVVLHALNFQVEGDLKPGEGIFIDLQGRVFRQDCGRDPVHAPCLFEYVYFARPESVLDGISVYDVRVKMGEYLAEKIKRSWKNIPIDVVIPVPETSRHSALSLATRLGLPYREGLVKNRYIARTFIMPGQAIRAKSVRQKLNVISSEFVGKRVLLVDDSIVRGTTSREIIGMARDAGAKEVYFASCAPQVKFPNVYGIDMPVKEELFANQHPESELAKALEADDLIYQDLNDLIRAVQSCNPSVVHFDGSIFDGQYVTSGVDEDYFQKLARLRNDRAKVKKKKNEALLLEVYHDSD